MWHLIRRFESLIFYIPFLIYASLRHIPYSFKCKNCGRRLFFDWEMCYRGLCDKCGNEASRSNVQTFYEDTYSRREATGATNALHGYTYAALKRVGFGRVLDVGCGAGFMLASLQSPQRELYGIDISPTAVKVGRASVEANFCVTDIREMPFKSNSFDWLICIDVLEHVDTHEQARGTLKLRLRLT